jgi:membrane protease YdiL (CAAX protease family)
MMDSSSVHSFLHTRAGVFISVLVITGAPFVFLLLPGEIGNIAIFVAMLLLLFLYAWLRRTGSSQFGLQKPDHLGRTILLGILYAFVSFLIFRITLEPLLEQWTGVPRDMSRFDYLKGNTAGLLQFLAIMWITAAFAEELYYRGFLIPSLAEIMNGSKSGWILAIFISASAFALSHSYQAVSGMLYTGIGAIFLSLVFLAHGKNLWIPIIAHGLHDTSGLLFIHFGIYQKIVHLLF